MQLIDVEGKEKKEKIGAIITITNVFHFLSNVAGRNKGKMPCVGSYIYK